MKCHVVCVLCIAHIIRGHAAELSCYQPPAPYGGYYHPAKRYYLQGEKIKHFCHEKYLGGGENDIVCEGNNKWKGNFSLCEKAAVADDAFLVYGFGKRKRTEIDKKGNDQNYETCVEKFPEAKSYNIELKNQKRAVDKVRITISKNPDYIKVDVKDQSDQAFPCKFSHKQRVDRLVYTCEVYSPKLITIYNLAHTRFTQKELCEVEIFYQSDALLCPLESLGIEHGEVFYNESHAWLFCNENYQPLQKVIKCVGRNHWSDTSRFKCEEKPISSSIGYVLALAVTLTVISFVCGCLAVWKSKRNSVRQTSTRTAATVNTTVEENEEPPLYELMLYEQIPNSTPTLPVTKKPTWGLPEITSQEPITLHPYYSQPLKENTTQPCCLYYDADHNDPYVDTEPQDAYKVPNETASVTLTES